MADAVMQITQVSRPLGGDFGQLRVRFADITFTGAGADTYVVGGFNVDLVGNAPNQTIPDWGVIRPDYVIPIGYATVSGATLTTEFVASFDPKTRKLQLFTSNGAAPAALAEATVAVTIAGLLGSISIRVMLLGQG